MLMSRISDYQSLTFLIGQLIMDWVKTAIRNLPPEDSRKSVLSEDTYKRFHKDQIKKNRKIGKALVKAAVF